jgi:hypothetical protein
MGYDWIVMLAAWLPITVWLALADTTTDLDCLIELFLGL